MKIYGIKPDENQMANLEPARYFNLAVEQINEAEEWLRTTNDICQPLLIHVDIFVYLSRKYPEMAGRRIQKVNVEQVRKTFDDWYDRTSKKIPAQFREGIRESATQLFDALAAL